MICNSGVGLTPRVEGRALRFSAGGLYDGLFLMVDDETRTYWSHVTGEALHGPLAGARLPVWGVTQIDAGAVPDPDRVALLRSRPGWARRLVMRFLFFGGKLAWFPPGFRATMGGSDPRLPEMEMGLGVVDGDVRRFYPRRAIGEGLDDRIAGRRIRIAPGASDRTPRASWEDGSRPLQMFTRWYGFAASFPGCEVHGVDSTRGET